MDEKHTPGPWRVSGGRGFGESTEIEPDVVKLEDDGACGDPECCGGSATTWVQIKPADAKLIAATPALLEACETLIFGSDLQVAIDKARAALTAAGRLS